PAAKTATINMPTGPGRARPGGSGALGPWTAWLMSHTTSVRKHIIKSGNQSSITRYFAFPHSGFRFRAQDGGTLGTGRSRSTSPVIFPAVAAGRRRALLLRCDGLRQRPHDGRDDVAVHELLADLALVAVGLAKSLIGLAAPVLAHGEVDADWRL